MERIAVRAFKAVDEPVTCAQYVREHTRILEDYGIANVSTNNADWVSDPNVHVVVIEHPQMGLVGGTRLHISRSPEEPLPIEQAIGRLDPHITALVDQRSAAGVAEMCGMWNALRFHGRGAPTLFGLGAISILSQLNVGSLLGLAARYTLDHSFDFGFRPVASIGDMGVFHAYPRMGFQGILISIDDPISLLQALPKLRERILSLRMFPKQTRVERTLKAELEVEYGLQLRENVINLQVYDAVQRDRLRFSA